MKSLFTDEIMKRLDKREKAMADGKYLTIDDLPEIRAHLERHHQSESESPITAERKRNRARSNGKEAAA